MTDGTRIGPYAIDRELGSGGMGTVWRAEGDDGSVVALKVVHEHVASAPGFVERFVREGEIGMSVRHPNVVATLGTGESGGRRWIALEYVEGRTLAALREEFGTVPEQLCRHVGREAAKGLAALHAAGLVHRDVKPENILVTADHVVKVMDLGIARGADDAQRMTSTGTFVGSIQYAAPEQFTGGGRGLDGRADLWALGVTLYEIATGLQPFEGADVPETLRNVLHGTPRRAGEVNPQLSAYFEEVLRTLLEKEREKRFDSADRLIEVLERGEDSEWWRERSLAIRAATRRPVRRIRIPRETSLFGREAEISALRAAFAKAAAGEGAVLLVEGEAGIGKSRLVDEFVGVLEREGEDVSFLWGSWPPGGAATASGAFSTAWREHFGGDESALRAALPEQPLLVPAFAALLRGDAPPPGAEPLGKDALQTVFVRSAQSLAKERTTIVLAEDLHFAPEEGRALFASLALAVPGHRILLVGTARPGLDEKWLAQASSAGAKRVAVPRLGAADLVRLLAESLRSEHLAEDLAGKIAAKSDGNPFFVFEILRGLRDGLFLTRREDGTWATTKRIEEIAIPPSIAELIQARVSDLGDEDRNLLEVASCAGFEFEPGLVGAVLGLPPIPLLQRLGAIEKRARLVRAAGRRFVFDHHQVQEHLYAGISEPLRERYHAAIADAIEHGVDTQPSRGSSRGAVTVSLAEHWLRAGLAHRGAPRLRTAIVELKRCFEYGRAARLGLDYLAVDGAVTASERAEVILAIAEPDGPLELLGLRDMRLSILEESAGLASAAGAVELGARIQSALASTEWLVGGRPTTERRFKIAVQALSESGAHHRAALVEGNLGNYLWSLGRIEEAEECQRRAEAACLAVGDRAGAARAAANRANLIQHMGRLEEAGALMESAARVLEVAGDRRSLSIIQGNLSSVRLMQGRFSDAETHARAQYSLATQNGDRMCVAQALGNLASAVAAEGRSDVAREMGQQALRICREIGDRRTEAALNGNLAILIGADGRLAAALDGHLENARILRELGLEAHLAIPLANIGQTLAQLGRQDEAEAVFSEAIEIARRTRTRVAELFSTAALCGLSAAKGDRDRARALGTRALELLDPTSQDAHSCETLTALSRAFEHFGDAEGALQLACRAAAVHSAPPELKHAAAARCAATGGVAEPTAHPERGDASAAAVELDWWRATRDRLHLVNASRLLGGLLSKNPPEFHAAMLRNVRVHREIVEACRAAGIPPPGE